MHPILAGLVAGLIATAPMTVFMVGAHRALPRRERYPLPPREITMEVAERAGVADDMHEPARLGATLLAHFGYGAATGAIYGGLAPLVEAPELAKGLVFGLFVWGGSYLALLPALGILQPATRHPARRNALMIGAHLVWGAFLAWLVSVLVR